MLKKVKWYIWIIVAVVLFVSILFTISCIKFSPVYLYRVLTMLDSSVDDYKIFPSRIIQKSEQPYNYIYELNSKIGELIITYRNNRNKEVSRTLKDFVNSTAGSSFIIVKDEKVIYEQYANGSGRDSINTSFSMAKSIVSLLIGKAIEDGFIRSEYQPITDYIHEFYGLEHITIKDLLTMRSDIYYEEKGFLWFRDDNYTYRVPDLRRFVLNHKRLTDKYSGKMHYNNYHPLLLGIILERSTGMSVSEYFEQSFWRLIGSEYDASWSLDSNKTQFEKMEGGINFRSIDFIKIGSMLLNNGYWNGHQIINNDWKKHPQLLIFQ